MAVLKCSLYGRDAPDMDNESGSEEDPDDDGTYGRPEECADVSINCARLHKVDATFLENAWECDPSPPYWRRSSTISVFE